MVLVTSLIRVNGLSNVITVRRYHTSDDINLIMKMI